MPQTTTATPGAHCRTCHDTATTVVEYRTPDPRSATGDETFGPFYILTCYMPRCVDTAEDDATYEGATDQHIDVRLLAPGEADAILGATEAVA